MKFSLVEPLFSPTIDDRPNLGCAMLLAACKNQGIHAKLIHGQTYYLEQVMVHLLDEVWTLVDRYKKFQGEKCQIEFQYLFSLDKREMGRELKTLYLEVILEKDLQTYFNQQKMSKITSAHRCIIEAYLHAIEKGEEDLVLINQYVNWILSQQPDIVGFSLYNPAYNRFQWVIRKKIKQWYPDLPIVIGGAYTPFIKKNTLAQFFDENSVDYLIIGQADLALPALIKKVERKEAFADIPSLCYLDGAKRVIINPVSHIPELNNLPIPDFSQFQLDKYVAPFRILPLQSSRGCSYRRCSFCVHHFLNMGRYDVIRPDRVAETIRHLQHSYKCDYFAFHDDELPAGRILLLCKAILERGINVRLYGYGRLVEKFLDEELITLMWQAGFRAMAWGLESGSQKVLDLMRKGTKACIAGHILKKFQENKIFNICFIFFGFPGEEEIDARKTTDLIQKYSECIHMVVSGTFLLNKDSTVWRDRKAFGVEPLEKDGYRVKSGMDKKTAETILKKFRLLCGVGKITNQLTINLSGGGYSRMRIFLMASHEMISSKEAVDFIEQGNGGKIVPVVPVAKYQEEEIIPMDLTKSSDFNHVFPLAPVRMSPIERSMVGHASGMNNLNDIARFIADEFGLLKEKADQEVAQFFTTVFSRNWAFPFTKKWHPIEVR